MTKPGLRDSIVVEASVLVGKIEELHGMFQAELRVALHIRHAENE